MFLEMFSSLAIPLTLLTFLAGKVTGKESIDFLMIGDWGGIPSYPYHTPGQVAVSKSMATWASENSADFVLALGDNFYFDGVEDADSSRFEATWENIYISPFPSLSIPWYLVVSDPCM